MESSHEENSLLGVRVAAKRFREVIEQRLKRLPPEDFLPLASMKLADASEHDHELTLWPPHLLLHAMEADCAYYRPVYHDPVDMRILTKVINDYKEYWGRVELTNLQFLSPEKIEDFEPFFMNMARRQLYLQAHAGVNDVGRGILLFLNGRCGRSEDRFKAEFGLDFETWFTFCMAVHAAVLKKRLPVIGPRYFLEAVVKIVPDAAVERCFAMLSQSIPEVGAKYKELRQHYPPELEWHLPSVLAERPLIQMPQGDFLVIHKPLVFRCATDGLYELCRDRFPEEFGTEFGSAFEAYAGSVLDDLVQPVELLREADLRKRVDGKVCDYIVVDADSILMLECKATVYSSTLTTERAVSQDNSTRKIAEGVEQLTAMAERVRAGALRDLIGEVGNRIILGAVVTYGEIYLANGDTYWGKRIKPLLSCEPERVFHRRPQVLDVRSLEQLVQLANSGPTLKEIFEDKLSKPMQLSGDWSAYLSNRLEGHAPRLPKLEEAFRSFSKRILSANGTRVAD